MKAKISFSLTVFTASLLFAPYVFTQVKPQKDSAIQEVSDLVEERVGVILKVLRNKKLSKDEKQKRVDKLITPLFHFELMAKLSLGKKHWSSFSKEQRVNFTSLFITSLKESYLEKIDLLTDETVEFNTPVRKKSKIHAPTEILSKDKRYQVIYKFYSKKGKWQVYDVEIEGISIIKSFSLQYSQFLRKNSVEELLEKMKSKLFDSQDAIKEKIAKKKANKA